MSKSKSRTILDTDKKKWKLAIREAKARIAQLNTSILIFKQNVNEGVRFPRKPSDKEQRRISALPSLHGACI